MDSIHNGPHYSVHSGVRSSAPFHLARSQATVHFLAVSLLLYLAYLNTVQWAELKMAAEPGCQHLCVPSYLNNLILGGRFSLVKPFTFSVFS